MGNDPNRLPAAGDRPAMTAPSPTGGACRICGAPARRRFQAREMMFGTRERFDYVECAACLCLQIAAIPRDLARFYPPVYHGRVGHEAAAGPVKRLARRVVGRLASVDPRDRIGFSRIARLHPALRHYAAFLEPYRRLGMTRRHRILDVGAGGGQLVATLRGFGFDRAIGIDRFLDSSALDARGRILVQRGEPADMAGPFDLIEFNHSLEHMPDQQAALRQCRALLAPDGAIRVRVPTVTSDAWDRYGTDWVQLDAPRHLYLHSHRSLELTAAQAGLRIAELACDSTSFQFWGSEQYRRDIALDDAASYAVDPNASIFTADQIAGFEAEARRLNLVRRGDQVDALLRPA
jgi:SAM-dependent methyltransferase